MAIIPIEILHRRENIIDEKERNIYNKTVLRHVTTKYITMSPTMIKNQRFFALRFRVILGIVKSQLLIG